jgi:hypothetical protein
MGAKQQIRARRGFAKIKKKAGELGSIPPFLITH